MARLPLWQFMSTENAQGQTLDVLFQESGLFSQEPLTALSNVFASSAKYDEVSEFFSDTNRVNAGTQRIVNQTRENIYSRFLFHSEAQQTLQIYMRTYIGDRDEHSFEIWQIILTTVLCCTGLIVLVIAFWGYVCVFCSFGLNAIK